MGNKTKFSIITVCFNCEDTIVETMESVLDQSNKNFEYIIIDGKSSDNTLEKINEVRKKCSQEVLVISEEDDGIYDAMNKGIEYANGQYLFFLNAGDTFYNKEVLWDIEKALEKESIDVIYGDIIQRGNNLYKRVKSISNINKFHLIMDRMICHQAIFAKKDCFTLVGKFNTNYEISADYNWFMSCYKEKLSIKHVPIIISNYDMNGISTQSHKIIQKEHELIIKEHYGFVTYVISKFKHGLGNLIRGMLTFK